MVRQAAARQSHRLILGGKAVAHENLLSKQESGFWTEDARLYREQIQMKSPRHFMTPSVNAIEVIKL